MVDVDVLADYVGASMPEDSGALLDASVVAEALVAAAFEGNWRPVPVEVYDECVKRTVKNLYQAGATSDSGGFFTAADGTAVPGVANDPLQKSWVIIKRYTSRL